MLGTVKEFPIRGITLVEVMVAIGVLVASYLIARAERQRTLELAAAGQA